VPEPKRGMQRPRHHSRASVKELASVAMELRAEIQRIVPTFVRTTTEVLDMSALSHPASLTVQQPMLLSRAPSAEEQELVFSGLKECAAQLWEEVAQSLPALVDATNRMLDGENNGSTNATAAELRQVTEELREGLVYEILPPLVNATRDWPGSSAHGRNPLQEGASVDELLRELAQMLPDFMNHTGGHEPNQPGRACAHNVATVISVLVGIAEAIKFTGADCGPSMLDCAVDVAFLIQQFAVASNQVADAAYTCGKANDGACLQQVAASFEAFSTSVERSIVAASDCVWPPESPHLISWCIVEVLDAINSAEKSAVHIDGALEVCNVAQSAEPVVALENVQFDLREAFLHALSQFLNATEA